MRRIGFRGAKSVPSYVLAACVSASGVAAAQPAAPSRESSASPEVGVQTAPAAQAPATRPDAAEAADSAAVPQAPEAASVPQAPEAGVVPAAATAAPPVAAEPTPQPSAASPSAPGPQPSAAPPAARYGRFGGDPEPPIEPGSWDPWASPVPGRFEHDGFFLRLNIGPAMARVSRSDVSWSGFAVNMGLSIGGSVVENFALHADFHTTLLPNPTQRQDGSKSSFRADIVFESMGVGATYHIMPTNMFVSATGGIGVLAFEDDLGDSKETGAGLMLGGMIGKEWWVGTEWGLGVAGQVQYVRVRDYVKDHARMNGLTFALLFTATFN